MKILALVSDGSEDNINGATMVMQGVKALMPDADLSYEVKHILSYTTLRDHDLFVCFGPLAATRLMGKQPLKFLRRYLHTKRDTGHKVMATYNGEVVIDSKQWLKVLLEDVIWGIAELSRERRLPDLTMTHAATGYLIGFDVETTGEFYDDICGRMLTCAVDTIGTAHDLKGCLTDLSKVSDDPLPRAIAGHNIKFDLKWAMATGVDLTHLPLHDTEVAAALIDDNITDNSLDFLRSRLTDIAPYKDMVDRANLTEENIGEVVRYNKYDAEVSRKVAEAQEEKIQDEGFGPIFELLMDLIPVYTRMEYRGVNIDQEWARRVYFESLEQKETALKELGLSERTLNSPKQMCEILYEDKGYPVKKKTVNGNPSVDAEALERIYEENGDEFVKQLLDYRDAEKVASTYLQKLPKYIECDGRIHPDYSLALGEFGGTRTGRTSCRRPNLQNIPRGHDVRGMYTPTEGYEWGKADHSQLELRIAGWLSGDERMLGAFRAKHDIHTATLSDLWALDYEEAVRVLQSDDRQWYERRVATKRVNFGILYGIGAKKLAAILRKEGIIMSVGECQEIIDKWRDNYKGFGKWASDVEHEVCQTGCVRTITGRRRTLPDADPDTYQGWRAQRQAVNFPVQSLASDITQIGMYLMDKVFRNYDAHLLMNVHDEINWEYRGTSPEEMAELARHVMEDETKDEFYRRFGVKIEVPLQADPKMGERWS